MTADRARRPLRSYFWRSFFASGALVAIVLLVLVLNPRWVWDRLAPHVLPAGVTVEWQQLKILFRPTGGLNSRLLIDLKGLAIVGVDPRLQIQNVDLHLVASFLPFEKRKVAVHELSLEAPQRIEVNLSDEVPPVEKPALPQQSFFEMARGPLRLTAKLFEWVRFEKTSVQIAGFQVTKGDGIFVRGRFNEKSVSEEKGIHVDVALDRLAGQDVVLQLKADPVVDQGPVHVGFKLLAKLYGVDTNQTADLRWDIDDVKFETRGPLAYRGAGLRLNAQPVLRVHADSKMLNIDLDSRLDGVPGPISRLEKVAFSFKLPLADEQAWVDRPADYKLTVDINPFQKKPGARAAVEKASGEKLPAFLIAELSGQTWLARVLGESSAEKWLTAQFRILNLKHAMLSWEGALGATILRREDGYKLEPSADVVVRSSKFQHLVKFLDAENILMPAPFDVLDGPIELSVNGLREGTSEVAGLKAKMITALTSRRQVVSLRMESTPTLDNTWSVLDVPVKLIFDDLRLDLPPLDPLGGMPRILPDSRVQRKPSSLDPKASKFRVQFSFEVETAKPGGIRLATKFADPYIPGTIKIVRGNDGRTGGFIQTEPFDINYLRRKMRVEKLRITLDDLESGVLPVDGRFGLQQGIYAIKILVTGPIKNPNIDFSSKPYLPREEIISVLLYGRTSDQLVSADAATAGSVQAAMADRAIGLFGLWAFATTPIKSFSYNAVTKVYAATLALSDDLSAQVGTNWEATTQLQLRQRLSTRWAVTAAWTPASATEDESRKLVLQWEKRF